MTEGRGQSVTPAVAEATQPLRVSDAPHRHKPHEH
jgi:hypothetical protein